MKSVFVQRDQATLLLPLMLEAFVQAQTTSAGSSSDEESGLGGAELVAIGVCSLIVLAFCLVCCIMVRNAKKRKQMALEKKEQSPRIKQQRLATHSMSETQIRNDHSFAATHKVPSRNIATAKTKS